MLKHAIDSNDKGDFFPVWGTCLGFEFLANITAQEQDKVLEVIEASKVSLPIKYLKHPLETQMFCQMGEQNAAELTKGEYLINMHRFGVSVETFERDPKLREFWDVTSTSMAPGAGDGRGGREFVASMEAKKYPIMATMFHSEKIS